MSSEFQSGLVQALMQAQQKARVLEQDGTNPGEGRDGYKYTTMESIIEESKRVLLECGVLFFVFRTTVRRADGTVTVRAKLCHADSGEKETVTYQMTPSERQGFPRDKAECAAVTQSIGYMLRGVLLLKRKLSKDIDEIDDKKTEAVARPPFQPKTPAKPNPEAEQESEFAKRIESTPNATMLFKLSQEIVRSKLSKPAKDRLEVQYTAKKATFARK